MDKAALRLTEGKGCQQQPSDPNTGYFNYAAIYWQKYKSGRDIRIFYHLLTHYFT